jgi:hypothetical protein
MTTLLFFKVKIIHLFIYLFMYYYVFITPSGATVQC